MRYLLPLLFFTSQALGGPYVPGTPGGPWTKDDIDIVKAKVYAMIDCAYNDQKHGDSSCFTLPGLPDNLKDLDLDKYSRPHEGDMYGPRLEETPTSGERRPFRSRHPTAARLVQLAFHDCLKYEDGSGGCDGCLNWKKMGYYRAGDDLPGVDDPELHNAYPVTYQTTNNKLQLSARALELIYTVPDWPPGAPILQESLRDSGKSRADLWQFAGNVALQIAVNKTNVRCYDPEMYALGKTEGKYKRNSEKHIIATEGLDKCQMFATRPMPFRWGRADCVPDEDAKWTPYPFEATKPERHSNPYGTGNAVIDDFKRDFGFTAEETISLMATHGMAKDGKNFEEYTKYNWVGGIKGTFSNVYFKHLHGKMHMEKDGFYGNYIGYMIGDKNGKPVNGQAFKLECRPAWNNTERAFGGPCHFRPSRKGCVQSPNTDIGMSRDCFRWDTKKNEFRQNKRFDQCKQAELKMHEDGYLYQTGGLPWNEDSCRGDWGFLFPYEVGFVLDFKVGPENIPVGCGNLDGTWTDTENSSKWVGIDLPGKDGQPACQANAYAPDGEALVDIVERFADDRQAWSKVFLDTWEKLQMNGYSPEDLTPVHYWRANLLGDLLLPGGY